jgi:hypothetical protein
LTTLPPRSCGSASRKKALTHLMTRSKGSSSLQGQARLHSANHGVGFQAACIRNPTSGQSCRVIPTDAVEGLNNGVCATSQARWPNSRAGTRGRYRQWGPGLPQSRGRLLRPRRRRGGRRSRPADESCGSGSNDPRPTVAFRKPRHRMGRRQKTKNHVQCTCLQFCGTGINP